MKLYGLVNCDSCRKAKAWLAEQGHEVDLHDLRRDGLDGAKLDEWLEALGWEALLNRRSRSWRELDAAQREGLDGARARQLLLDNRTLIRRPVLEHDQGVSLGFSPKQYAELLGG